jgi:hypothetical protein
MAGTLEPIVNSNQLKTTLLNNPPVTIRYNNVFDALKIYFDNPNQKQVIHYLDDYVALIFSPESKEIIGIQVEAFEKVFIHKHTRLETAWRLTDNCQERQLEDIGDMMLFVQVRQEKVTNEVRTIAESLLLDAGNQPKLAYV